MAKNEQFGESVSRWLEETAPARLPERVLEATFERTRKSRQHVGWRAPLGINWRPVQIPRLVPAVTGAVVVVVAAALALNYFVNQQGLGGPNADPRTPFLGTWISTSDADGGTQRMTAKRAASLSVEIVVTDTIASVCDLTPSTMTGTGTVNGNSLVIPTPDYRCDDGSEPRAVSGPPLEEQLRNLMFVRDPQREQLTDNFGGLWLRPAAAASTPVASTPAISDSMWPQSTLEEVRLAQELADAGDPDYTWQVGARLTEDDPFAHVDGLELVDRFIREVLGWEAYLFNPWEGGDFNVSIGGTDGWVDGALTDQRYLRCAPGRTNPLYPPQPDSEQPGDSCAPTIDDRRYESVSLDLAQLARQSVDGIWVVNHWRLTAPFAQADPVAVEARATERLEEFLAARIAGKGAEGHVQVDPDIDVPLLYAITSGAPYERYEIERVDGPLWPYGRMTFSARLFADDDATVVEQEIRREQDGGLWLNANSTTQNGQPVVLTHTSSDGEVTVSAPSTWEMWWPEAAHVANVGVWFGGLWRPEDFFGSGERVEFVDPVAYDSWCAANGGSPLLTAPADAAAIAEQVIADPDFEASAPVAARIGGLEAVSIDVALAPGGKACGVGMIEISRWIHTLEDPQEPGWRLRLYLVDLPQGMSVQTLAITVVAPEERFQEFIEETAPIIESIEFQVP